MPESYKSLAEGSRDRFKAGVQRTRRKLMNELEARRRDSARKANALEIDAPRGVFGEHSRPVRPSRRRLALGISTSRPRRRYDPSRTASRPRPTPSAGEDTDPVEKVCDMRLDAISKPARHDPEAATPQVSLLSRHNERRGSSVLRAPAAQVEKHKGARRRTSISQGLGLDVAQLAALDFGDSATVLTDDFCEGASWSGDRLEPSLRHTERLDESLIAPHSSLRGPREAPPHLAPERAARVKADLVADRKTRPPRRGPQRVAFMGGFSVTEPPPTPAAERRALRARGLGDILGLAPEAEEAPPPAPAAAAPAPAPVAEAVAEAYVNPDDDEPDVNRLTEDQKGTRAIRVE